MPKEFRDHAFHSFYRGNHSRIRKKKVIEGTAEVIFVHFEGDYLSIVLPKWKCVLLQGKWNMLQGNWVERGNVWCVKADGLYCRETGSYGEMCRTSRQVDRTSREMARRAILVYDAKDSLSN